MRLSIQWVALQTIVRKEITRILRIWTQALLSPLIIQTLYFIIFGQGIGSWVGPIHGVSYMSFIVPGFVMMVIINGAFSNVVSSFCSDKFQGNLEEILVSPISDGTIILGYVLGGVIRGIWIGILVFLVSLFFGLPNIKNLWVVLFFTLLNGALISLAALLNGILAHNVDEEDLFRNFILKPMIYLGGVFYSIHSLPILWKIISYFNPILYMINGFRYGFFGFSDVSPFVCALVLLTGIFILVSSNLWLLKKGIGARS